MYVAEMADYSKETEEMKQTGERGYLMGRYDIDEW